MLSFLTNWNDFLWPVYVLFSPESQTLPAGSVHAAVGQHVRYDLLMAGAVIASLPVLVLYVLRAAVHHRGRPMVGPQGLTGSTGAATLRRTGRHHPARHGTL